MNLPCMTCKYKKETIIGHRTYVGCIDEKKKLEGFKKDNYFYDHKCTNYEKE